jgi:hypothetical protein
MRILRVCFLHTFATCFAYSLPAASITFPLGSDCAFSGIVMAVVQFRNSLVNSLLPGLLFFVISCDFWFFLVVVFGCRFRCSVLGFRCPKLFVTLLALSRDVVSRLVLLFLSNLPRLARVTFCLSLPFSTFCSASVLFSSLPLSALLLLSFFLGDTDVEADE